MMYLSDKQKNQIKHYIRRQMFMESEKHIEAFMAKDIPLGETVRVSVAIVVKVPDNKDEYMIFTNPITGESNL